MPKATPCEKETPWFSSLNQLECMTPTKHFASANRFHGNPVFRLHIKPKKKATLILCVRLTCLSPGLTLQILVWDPMDRKAHAINQTSDRNPNPICGDIKVCFQRYF